MGFFWGRFNTGPSSYSMIIRDLDIVSVTIPPSKTDPVLIVNSDAVLSMALTFKSLQTVARQCAQITKSLGRV
jgi:hypothetical protein